MIEHEVARSKKVILGLVSVNGRRAYALFYTSGPHSFVSEVFVHKVDLIIGVAEKVQVISLASGIHISSTRVCKNYEVTMSVTLTKMDLIVFQISDFDVILGLD